MRAEPVGDTQEHSRSARDRSVCRGFASISTCRNRNNRHRRPCHNTSYHHTNHSSACPVPAVFQSLRQSCPTPCRRSYLVWSFHSSTDNRSHSAGTASMVADMCCNRRRARGCPPVPANRRRLKQRGAIGMFLGPTSAWTRIRNGTFNRIAVDPFCVSTRRIGMTRGIRMSVKVRPNCQRRIVARFLGRQTD